MQSLSRVRLCVTPWTVAHQAPLSMGLSRQEYWSGVPLPSPLSTTKATMQCAYMLGLVQLFATSWTVVHQTLTSMGFPRQEYQSGLHIPPPGDQTHVSCNSCIGRFFTTELPGNPNEASSLIYLNLIIVNYMKLKIEFLSHISHISSAQ